MKASELRKLEKKELIHKCNELVDELKKVRFSLKSGNLSGENINKARSLKKDIAKMKTILTELSLIDTK